MNLERLGKCILAAQYVLIRDELSVKKSKIESPFLTTTVEAAVGPRMSYAEGVLDAIKWVVSKPGEKMPERLAAMIEAYERNTGGVSLPSEEQADPQPTRNRMDI